MKWEIWILYSGSIKDINGSERIQIRPWENVFKIAVATYMEKLLTDLDVH